MSGWTAAATGAATGAATAAAVVLTALFVGDRAAKAWLVTRFFARPPAPTPAPPTNGWPAVALIQPVTRGATHLAQNLSARARLTYPGLVRHLVVCDRDDVVSQTVCHTALPGSDLILAEPDMPATRVASKVAKMAAGAARLGDVPVVCFVDDDILLPPGALNTLVAPLLYAAAPAGVTPAGVTPAGVTPAGVTPAGATFGLACQVSWENGWESLMSGFVNANALFGYVPLTFFTAPYTITGHVFALRRVVFEETGGMAGLAGRFDDDHEIARRVRGLGLPVVQTALLYQVANALPTFRLYCAQMRRWFVMPRQAMVPYLTGRERVISGLLSVGNLLPPLVLLIAVFWPTRIAFACVLIVFAAFLACYIGLEARYLPARTPVQGLLLLPIIAFLTPLHVLLALGVPGNRILWRGHSYRAKRGGALQVDEK